MSWTIRKRNQSISAATDTLRVMTAAWHMKDALIAAGWTCLGSGNGTGSGVGGWDNVDHWGVSPPTAALPWIGLQNADGVQLLLQVSSSNLKMAFLYGATYAGTGADEDSWPDRGGIPAGECADSGSAISGTPTTGSDFYLQVATSDDGNSAWMWTKGVSTVTTVTALVKLTDTKAADTNPYWGLRNGSAGTTSCMTVANLSTTPVGFARHPVGNRKVYGIGELSAGSARLFDTIPADPNSSKEQLLECLAISTATSYQHLKGKIPGIVRNSTLRSVGDTFDSGVYVCVGEYGLPWGTSLTPMT